MNSKGILCTHLLCFTIGQKAIKSLKKSTFTTKKHLNNLTLFLSIRKFRNVGQNTERDSSEVDSTY